MQTADMGGLTCDSHDYYNSEAHTGEVFMPMINDEEPLYMGFFHTGAYQESLGGYGGIQHCLIPAPKHVLVSRNEDGEITTELFAPEQTSESMLEVLGYKKNPIYHFDLLYLDIDTVAQAAMAKRK